MSGDDDSGDKTEEPTGKRLEEARKEGNIAQTNEAKALASMLAALVVIGILAPGMANDLGGALTRFVAEPHQIAVDADSMQRLLLDVGLAVGKVMAVPMAVVVIFAISAALIQHKGFMWVPKKIAPKFSKLSPLAGIKRLFSAESLMELLKQVVKLGVVGSVMFMMVWKDAKEFIGLPNLDLTSIMAYIHDRAYDLIFVALLMMVVLAVADYLFVHWRWMEKMKMSKQEVKDEHKLQEGDPQVKARIRSLRMARARRRMMTAVPRADVVVTNPTHFAVALKYDQDSMSAPVLVAKGADLVAKRIRDLANEHDVPVVENPPLARALYATVDLDEEVPQEHYKAVAEVIGYVMRLKGKLAN